MSYKQMIKRLLEKKNKYRDLLNHAKTKLAIGKIAERNKLKWQRTIWKKLLKLEQTIRRANGKVKYESL